MRLPCPKVLYKTPNLTKYSPEKLEARNSFWKHQEPVGGGKEKKRKTPVDSERGGNLDGNSSSP